MVVLTVQNAFLIRVGILFEKYVLTVGVFAKKITVLSKIPAMSTQTRGFSVGL